MAYIYRNIKEIPLPEFAHVNKSDGRVFLMEKDSVTGKRSRKVIGKATSEATFQPNEKFRILYPEVWKEHFPDSKIPDPYLSCGLFAAFLAIGHRTGLYTALIQSYGPVFANAFMDYSLFSILEQTDSSLLYTDSMAQHVLFSEKAYSDSWLSEFFGNKIDDRMNFAFDLNWLRICKESGTKRVWVGIDGSNNDCVAGQTTLAEKGKAKSQRNVDLVSYIYAVDAETGMPLCHRVNNGGMPDSRAFDEMCAVLTSNGFEVEGFILDRGFCSQAILDHIAKKGLKYVMMLKEDTNGHVEMLRRFASEERWNVRKCINKYGLFGIEDREKVFRQSKEKTKICLYFSGQSGTERALALIRKIMECEEDLGERIAKGVEDLTVPSELRKYVSVVDGEDGRKKVAIDYDRWQADVDFKGFYSLACSDGIGLAEADRIYNLRDSSEKQFSAMKSQLGFDVTRTHHTPGIENKLQACFVASILRNRFMAVCRDLGLETNRMIREMDRVRFGLLVEANSPRYRFINNLGVRQRKLLGALGLDGDSFRLLADDLNCRMFGSVSSPVRKMPSPPERKKPGRPRKEKTEENKPSRGRGRPKGSRNKSTLLKEKATDNRIKRGRGRPKGSKDSWKRRPRQTKKPASTVSG